jgi:hypothetical protein
MDRTLISDRVDKICIHNCDGEWYRKEPSWNTEQEMGKLHQGDLGKYEGNQKVKGNFNLSQR